MTTITHDDTLKSYDVFILSVDWMQGGKVIVVPSTINVTEKEYNEGLKEGFYFKTKEEAENKINKQYE